MASKISEAQSDTFIDHDTGLVLRQDPFGGEGHDVIGFADASEWDIVEEDFGPVHSWESQPILVGILVNQKTVDIDHDDNRGETPTNIYCFQSPLTNERVAVYGNFQLDNALGCPVPTKGLKSPYLGRMVYVKWEGKREQGKGNRSLNVYTIAVKKPAVTE